MGDGLCSLLTECSIFITVPFFSLKDSYIWTGQREEYIVRTYQITKQQKKEIFWQNKSFRSCVYTFKTYFSENQLT